MPGWFALFFLFFISIDAWSQQCDISRPASTPDDQFVINDDGTVTVLESGLTWMRCVVGQQWNGKKCSGEAMRFDWGSAFKEEDKMNSGAGYAGLNNWRLPQVAELASIVERQCINPRINLSVFPLTPAASFWTGNHKKNSTEKMAFAMSFDKNGVQKRLQQEKLYLRLVSGR